MIQLIPAALVLSASFLVAEPPAAQPAPPTVQVDPAAYESAKWPAHNTDLYANDFQGKKLEVTLGQEQWLTEKKDLTGQVLVLDFWATWCGPCIRELPNVIEAYDKYKEDGFEIVGISLDDDPAKVRAFSRQRSTAWPMVADGKGWKAEVGQLYRVRSIPAMWLVDGDTGKILATSDTLRGDGALEQAIQAALVVKERERMKQGEGAGEGAAPGSGS